MKKTKKAEQSNQENDSDKSELAKLTADLQRLQADFINYRRRVEEERRSISEASKAATILSLLPVLDNIDLATKHLPDELADNTWAKGIVGLNKSLGKTLSEMGLTRISADPGQVFDPNIHEAVSMDEDSEGDEEVISEELRSGYLLGTQVVRHSLVKVKRQPAAPNHNPEKIVKDQMQDEPSEKVKPED